MRRFRFRLSSSPIQGAVTGTTLNLRLLTLVLLFSALAKCVDGAFARSSGPRSGNTECARTNYYPGAEERKLTVRGACKNVSNFPYDIAPEVATAGPAAARFFPNGSFPGHVDPRALRVKVTVELDESAYGWQSTGVYAAPGERITIGVPHALANTGLRWRIGAHSDDLTRKGSQRRDAVITTEAEIRGEQAALSNKRGGPVYVLTGHHDREGRREWTADPKGELATLRIGTFTVTLSNVVRAPRFILGKTDPQTWVDELRCLSAPWAEMESNRIVFVVPSSVIRNLDDPEPVLRFWARVMEAIDELAARSSVERLGKERIVADVDIAAGYMHSGYPIMTHLDVIKLVLDREERNSEKPWSVSNAALSHDGSWGHFHELGHNAQRSPWTFAGTGEVTVNWFSLYASCKALGIQPWEHWWLEDSYRFRAQSYLAGDDANVDLTFAKRMGSRYAGLGNRDPGVALVMYAQIIREFGFEPFRTVVRRYRENKNEFPRSNECLQGIERACEADKMNSWVHEISLATGHDLSAFHRSWGLPVDRAQTLLAGAALPDWKPQSLFAWPGTPQTVQGVAHDADYTIFSVATGFVLDPLYQGTEPGNLVIMYGSANNANQQFSLRPMPDGPQLFSIVGRKSGRCLGLNARGQLALAECATVGGSTAWRVETARRAGEVAFTLQNQKNRGYLTNPNRGGAADAVVLTVPQIDSASARELWLLRDLSHRSPPPRFR